MPSWTSACHGLNMGFRIEQKRYALVREIVRRRTRTKSDFRPLGPRYPRPEGTVSGSEGGLDHANIDLDKIRTNPHVALFWAINPVKGGLDSF